MSQEAVGRRYAQAIFDIGREAKTLDALCREVSAFATTYTESAELSAVLDNPLVPEPARETILVDVAKRLGGSETTVSALRVIMRNRRLRALPDVARHLAKLVDDAQSMERAFVTSAAPLSEAYVAKLKAELEKAMGRKVTVTHTVDPSLIAGVVTRVGDKVVDGSLRARLKSFRDSIDPQASLAGT